MADPGPATPVTPTVVPAPAPSAEKQRPTAIATTKRKFNKLLESLTSSPAKASNLNTSTESPAKRLRLEARAKLASRATSQKRDDGNVQSELLKSRLATESVVGDDGKKEVEPNYMPWSREQFLRRLKTFADVRRWTSKPDAINEVQWAKVGWVCEGFNRVCCKGGCERRVVLDLRPKLRNDNGEPIEDTEDLSVEVEDDLVRQYESMIVTEHDESCLWRRAGCRDDIYRVTIAQPAIWKSDLSARYESLQSISTSLPTLEQLQYPFNLNDILGFLPSDLFRSTTEASATAETASSEVVSQATINQPALAFALCGWHGDVNDAQNPMATCHVCFRRIGLWMYTSANGEAEKLDLFDAHREYCPWVSAKSQSMPGSYAGLSAGEILQRVIRVGGATAARARGDAEDTRPVTPLRNGQESYFAIASPASSAKSKEDNEREDKLRFARLRELTKSMGFGGSGLKKGHVAAKGKG